MSISSVGGSNPYAYTPPAANTGGTKPANKDADLAAAGKAQSSPEDEFLNFAKMSPADRMRAQFLAAHGLTEDDLKNMDPKERQKIEDQIREEIEQALKKDTEKKAGGLVNISA